MSAFRLFTSCTSLPSLHAKWVTNIVAGMQTYAVALLHPLFLETRDQLLDESQGLSRADVIRFVGRVDVDLESESPSASYLGQ